MVGINVLRTLLLTGLMAFVPAGLSAATLEYEVKAAFIYNFAKFIKWPQTAQTNHSKNLFLCILGRDPFGNALDDIEGKNVQGQTLRIRRIKNVEERSACKILFISTSESDNLPIVLNTISQDKGLLSVSDISGFANNGGVIELVHNNDKIRFTVNMAAARLTKLDLSSKILRLATIIDGDWERE